MARWLGRSAMAAWLAVQVGAAAAGVVTLTATERGFITQSGVTNPTNNPPAERDYLLGNCSFNSCSGSGGGEYRNFFGFAIPALSGSIVSVELQIDTVGVDLSQALSLTATFASLNTTSSFAALGTGTVYGSIVYTAADANTTRSAVLNQDAIAAVLADEGGTLLIGGHATFAAQQFDPASPNELVYEHSGPNDATRLIITTLDVPEPGALPLLGAALFGVWVAGLRRVR